MRYVIPKCFFAVVLLVAVQFSFAQDRKLATWKMYLSYGNSEGVTDAGDRVYSAGQKSVFSYEKSTGAIQTYDKATGLSDVGIKTINYDATSKALVIIYNNSNLDLIYNNTDIYNIPDIKNKATTSAVNVYDVSFYNGNAYISSDLGISVINLDRKEITNTYTIGSSGAAISVYSTSTDGVNIYAATAEGIKHASFSAPNLQDYIAWTTYDSTSGIRPKKGAFVAAYNNKAYAVITGTGNTSDSLFELNGNVWSPVALSGNDANTFTSLAPVNGTLYFSTWSKTNFNGLLGKISPAGVEMRQTQGHGRPGNWFESNGIAWESDYYNGLFKNTQGNVESVIPDGPFSSNVFSLKISDGTLYVAPGGVDDSWTNSYNGDGFFIYRNGRWSVCNQYTTGLLQNYVDFVCLAHVPGSNKTYFGSCYTGLVEYDENPDGVKTYDSTNSILEQVYGDRQRIKITALAADQNGNIWLGNAGAKKPLKVIKPDGTWQEFQIPYTFQLMKKMLVDQNNQVWAALRSTPGELLVFSYNGTIDDPSDDVSTVLTVGAGSGGLPDANVNCLAEDKDGNIWAGTNQGIGIFYCAGSVLTSSRCDADQIKVERDGYVGYLFGTEIIRAITVDAANRKWIGTTNGVWLISADGKTELLKFNTDNSPLPSNQITDIAINDETGEVFIGTTQGLVSYQGDAIEACTDCKETALVYPNPVKPDYTGPIAIKGLTDNAYVKITDASGILVFQGHANGTQMIWDGNGYTGKRAKSGVYLVFSSTDLGKEKKVAKILLMN